jgi:transposase
MLQAFSERVAPLEAWLKAKAEADAKVQLLQTQRGVGYLTALVTVHTLGDVTRFTKLSKQVAAFAGLDPLEKSSAGRVRFGSISKAGSSLLRFQLGLAAQQAARPSSPDVRLKSFYKPRSCWSNSH